MQLPSGAENARWIGAVDGRVWHAEIMLPAAQRTGAGFVYVARQLREAMAHWLAKTEPSTYAWQDLVAEKRARWDGVRNAQARNNLAEMKKGDEVLIYHSGDERAVVGIAKVARTAYADPTTDDDRWVCVDLTPVRELAAPVPLSTIKALPALRDMALVRQGRLSVTPVSAEEFRAVVALAKPSRAKHA